jgi:hypothetical protein
MNIQNSDTSSWALDLSGFQPEYTAVKCSSVLAFYQLRGKTTNLVANNLEPIPNLYYTVYVPHEDRYYYKEFRDYDLDTLYFYRRSLTFSGEDQAVFDLTRNVQEGNVHILFTTEQIAEMSSFLIRLYKSHFNNEGKVPYKLYLQLMEESLRREDYADNHKDLTGYRTVLKIYDEKISAIWKQCYKE